MRNGHEKFVSIEIGHRLRRKADNISQMAYAGDGQLGGNGSRQAGHRQAVCVQQVGPLEAHSPTQNRATLRQGLSLDSAQLADNCADAVARQLSGHRPMGRAGDDQFEAGGLKVGKGREHRPLTTEQRRELTQEEQSGHSWLPVNKPGRPWLTTARN
jgi:hypothetical protein